MQCLASLPNDIAGRSLTILVPSKKVKTEYDALFGNAKMEILPFKIAVDTQHMAPRPADQYSSVRFLMSGRPMERKVTWWLSARRKHAEFNGARQLISPTTFASSGPGRAGS